MRKILLTSMALVLLSSFSASAQGNPNPNNPNLQDGGNGNGNNGCGNGNGGNDGSGCTPGQSGSTPLFTIGDVTLKNTNTDTNTLSNFGNASATVNHRYITVATAYAPQLTSGIDTCLGSMSGGAQSPVFGISLGTTKHDQTCETINRRHTKKTIGSFESSPNLPNKE